MYQRLIPTGERSGLLTHIAMTVMRFVVHAPAPENAATPQRRRRRKPRRGSNVKFVLSWRRKTGTQEENGALTAPCSIHGQPARLLVDTGSFVTIFTEPVLKSLGVGLQPTYISARFPTGTSRKVSAAQINDLKIGDFKVRPGKFGVTPSPNFAPWQGSSRMFGILGMDTLYNCHAIIDLDGMNLFLK